MYNFEDEHSKTSLVERWILAHEHDAMIEDDRSYLDYTLGQSDDYTTTDTTEYNTPPETGKVEYLHNNILDDMSTIESKSNSGKQVTHNPCTNHSDTLQLEFDFEFIKNDHETEAVFLDCTSVSPDQTLVKVPYESSDTEHDSNKEVQISEVPDGQVVQEVEDVQDILVVQEGSDVQVVQEEKHVQDIVVQEVEVVGEVEEGRETPELTKRLCFGGVRKVKRKLKKSKRKSRCSDDIDIFSTEQVVVDKTRSQSENSSPAFTKSETDLVERRSDCSKINSSLPEHLEQSYRDITGSEAPELPQQTMFSDMSNIFDDIVSPNVEPILLVSSTEDIFANIDFDASNITAVSGVASPTDDVNATAEPSESIGIGADEGDLQTLLTDSQELDIFAGVTPEPSNLLCFGVKPKKKHKKKQKPKKTETTIYTTLFDDEFDDIHGNQPEITTTGDDLFDLSPSDDPMVTVEETREQSLPSDNEQEAIQDSSEPEVEDQVHERSSLFDDDMFGDFLNSMGGGTDTKQLLEPLELDIEGEETIDQPSERDIYAEDEVLSNKEPETNILHLISNDGDGIANIEQVHSVQSEDEEIPHFTCSASEHILDYDIADSVMSTPEVSKKGLLCLKRPLKNSKHNDYIENFRLPEAPKKGCLRQPKTEIDQQTARDEDRTTHTTYTTEVVDELKPGPVTTRCSCSLGAPLEEGGEFREAEPQDSPEGGRMTCLCVTRVEKVPRSVTFSDDVWGGDDSIDDIK